MEYASIIPDQRNTGGIDPQSDLQLYQEGREPVEYLMVYDALKASDVLRDHPGVEPEKIAMMGSSNGERFAIIATAIDKSIAGVVAISTCGYDTDSIDPSQVTDTGALDFYRSIDPDNYLSLLPPRRIFMLHSSDDPVISSDAAAKTFAKARKPKNLEIITGSSHGYNPSMQPYLEEGLEEIFEE